MFWYNLNMLGYSNIILARGNKMSKNSQFTLAAQPRINYKIPVIMMGFSVLFMAPYIAGFLLKLMSFPINLRFWYGNLRSIEMLFIILYFICFLSMLLSFISASKNRIRRCKVFSFISLISVLLAVLIQLYSDSLINKAGNFILDSISIVFYIIPLIIIAAYTIFQLKANISFLLVLLSIISLVHSLLMVLNLITYFNVSQLYGSFHIFSLISVISYYFYFVSFALFTISMAIYFLKLKSIMKAKNNILN